MSSTTRENFKHFYLAFISITVAEDTWEEPTGDPVLTCTYTYQDKEGSDTIEYYKVSDRRYAIVENGQLMGLALSDTVDLAMQDLELPQRRRNRPRSQLRAG